jgi:HSP20 family molecular chaperone IbpA
MLYSPLFPDITFGIPGLNLWAEADLELYETDAWITLYLQLPGVPPEAIDTQILPDRIVLSVKQTVVPVSRLSVGAALTQRTVPLPERVNPNQATVMIEGRALVVTIPKRAACPTQSLAIEPLQRRWVQVKHWMGQKLKGVAEYLLAD